MLDKNCKNYIVTQSNKLAYSKYSLSLNAQKLIMILAAHVQPDDEDFKEIEFKAIELSKILDISVDNIYRDLPNITKELVTKLVLFKSTDDFKDKNFIQGTFLSTAEYKDGKVLLEFSPKVKPYLLALKRCFSKFKLESTLNFKSKYSMRFYQLFKANYIKGEFIIGVSDLRELLNLTQKSYLKYYTFKNRVLNVAVEEINMHTELNVSFDPIKCKRETVKLKFYVNKKGKKIEQINEIKEIIEEDNELEYLIKLFENENISKSSIEKIYKKANYDIKKIKEVYNYSKTQNIRNLVGYMLSMVEGDNFVTPVHNKNKIHNFTEREYSKELEEQLLKNTYLNYEEEKNKENDVKDIVEDVEELDISIGSLTLNELQELLSGSLIETFGESDYKFWMKQAIDEMSYSNNEIIISFSSSVKAKVAKEKGIISFINELILSIDSSLKVTIE